jgi:SH3 domain protein
MRPSALLLLGLCAALLSPFGVRAETRYVTDQLTVPLRAGDNLRYRIIKMLPSGTALEVLGVNPTSKYARVRTADGQVGFIPQDQLQEEPAARARVAELEARLAALQQDPDSVAARLNHAQSELSDLKVSYQTIAREKQLLEQQLATIRHASANVLDITNDRERLRMQVADLTRTRADLEQENRDLQSQTQQRWFLIGAGVLVGGILLGLLLPRLRLGRRKSTWGSL